MAAYKNIEELKKDIRHLEVTKEVQMKHLKESFDNFIENIKPMHIIQNTYQNVKSSPHLGEIIVGGILAISGGFLARKLIVKGTATILRKIFGVATQSAVAFLLAKYSSEIKYLGTRLLQQIKNRRNRPILTHS